ncbi:MAG: hypothetical protein ISR64_01970 [Deltaproteobacteria bacterium]|nr:hypothetical protein [Deltaproteobacteria bacterium]
MKNVARILTCVGAVVILIALVFSWGTSSYWRLVGDFVEGPVVGFYATETRSPAEPGEEPVVGRPAVQLRSGPEPSTADILVLAAYIFLPLITLLAALSSCFTNRGYYSVLIAAALNLAVIFYTQFSEPFGTEGSPVMRLGAAHTLIWFASVAVLVGAVLGIGGEEVSKAKQTASTD